MLYLRAMKIIRKGNTFGSIYEFCAGVRHLHGKTDIDIKKAWKHSISGLFLRFLYYIRPPLTSAVYLHLPLYCSKNCSMKCSRDQKKTTAKGSLLYTYNNDVGVKTINSFAPISIAP